MEHTVAVPYPIRHGPPAGRYERFGLRIPQHFPIAGGFASREIDRVSAHEFSDGRGIIFLFGKMAGTDVQPRDGRGPI